MLVGDEMDELNILPKNINDKYMPIISDYLYKVNHGERIEYLDLTNTGLNVSTLDIILENIGYKESSYYSVFPVMIKTYAKSNCRHIRVIVDINTFMLKIYCDDVC